MTVAPTGSTLPIQPGAAVETFPGIGHVRARQLETLGIHTVRDLAEHYPRAYRDCRVSVSITEAPLGSEISVVAEVVSARQVQMRGRLSMALVTARVGTDIFTATFFGRGFLAATFKPGMRVLLTGTVAEYKGPALKNPDYEFLREAEDEADVAGHIVPVYPLTEGLGQRQVRNLVKRAVDAVLPGVQDPLPPSLREKHALMPLAEALREVHAPVSPESCAAARRRLAYDELLLLQLRLQVARLVLNTQSDGIRHKINGPILRSFGKKLPFALTPGQDQAISEIFRDMASPRAMFRLLQGDVGCGKTMVALHAICAATDGGYQTAMMAPTEILAEQHAAQLCRLLVPLGLEVALLTGSGTDSKGIRARIAAGKVQVAVGTQALIQETTTFHKLGLVVVDEQHRFGVLQRERLRQKGRQPDFLQMTATPIPRTLALSLCGGMDLSTIRELPPGRIPIKTHRVPPSKVDDLYTYIRQQAEAGYQTYIVCPLVEESENRPVTAVIQHYEQISAGPLAGLRTALLHGRMPSAEKEQIMAALQKKAIDVLFSTTVIEVGIDIPTATTIVIEDAGHFGLTQLHQLRGRVGRGTEPSRCFLMGTPATGDGKRRLELLCAHQDGFELAEQDLVMRGPGEFLGLRQAGLSDLKVADPVRDLALLQQAHIDASAILAEDPGMALDRHEGLQERLSNGESGVSGS